MCAVRPTARLDMADRDTAVLSGFRVAEVQADHRSNSMNNGPFFPHSPARPRRRTRPASDQLPDDVFDAMVPDDDGRDDMSEPVLLDLFCGGGGATKGYQRAGFYVVGVDIDPQPDYCGDDFVQADALDYLAGHGMKYDAIHASPPCQASTALTTGTNAGREYPQLIPATRSMLAYYRVPTVLENVQGSDLRRDLVLCGEMFGLGVIRHRYFEISGFDAVQPAHKPHRGRVRGWRHGQYHDGPYVAVYGDGGGKGSVPEWQQAMGIDWTSDRKTIAEAIPPAFTEHIGRQIMAHIQEEETEPTTPAEPEDPSAPAEDGETDL